MWSGRRCGGRRAHRTLVVLQEIGQAAQQAAPRPQMATLAGLGAGGRYGANIHRDLVRKLGIEKLPIAAPLEVELPLWNAKLTPARKVEWPYPLLLPHELFGLMYENNIGEFNQFVLGPGSLSAFWDNIADGDQRLVGHPVGRLSREARSCVIPLRLHGGGVPIGKTKHRSLDIISISSLTGGRGPTWDTRWIWSAIVDGAKYKGDGSDTPTGTAVWEVLAWSLACLTSGTWPLADWQG